MTLSVDALHRPSGSTADSTTQAQAQEAAHATPCMLLAMERLSHAFDEVKRLCPDLPVLAIRWLHLNHPIQPLQDAWLRQELSDLQASRGDHPTRTHRWRNLGILVWRVGICWLYAAYLAVRLARLRWMLRHEMRALRRQSFDVVAKTWRFGAQPPANGQDFYYGDLQERLADRGMTMLLLCGDATAGNWRTFSKAHASTVRGWLPELCLVPALAPFHMAWRQILACARLLRLGRCVNDPLVKRVVEHASRDCLSRRIVPFGLYAWIGTTATRIWHPKAFVTLYEGRGWESCLRQGVKAADPSCQTVGYQHTIVLRHQLALLRQTHDTSPYVRPDAVLCLGARTQAMLRGSHPRSTLIPFGTFRRFPARQQDAGPAPERRTVLVVPEGYPEEEILLFNSALRAARVLPDHRFIFRCHPVSPFEQVRGRLEMDPGTLPNVEVSDRPSITDDFARASVVLYRGSSSVLYAVLHGLKPVYLHDERFHDVDPLFEVTTWRERASSAQALEQVLARYAKTPAQEAVATWREAARYVEEYTIPVTDASVDQWLATLDKRHHRMVR